MYNSITCLELIPFNYQYAKIKIQEGTESPVLLTIKSINYKIDDLKVYGSWKIRNPTSFT